MANVNASGVKLNQRLQSHWILNHSEKKSVFNLFSNTGLMALAAAKGKASSVTLVELQKSLLNIANKFLKTTKWCLNKLNFYVVIV